MISLHYSKQDFLENLKKKDSKFFLVALYLIMQLKWMLPVLDLAFPNLSQKFPSTMAASSKNPQIRYLLYPSHPKTIRKLYQIYLQNSEIVTSTVKTC